MASDCLLFYADVHMRDMGSFTPWNRTAENGLTLELINILAGIDFIAERIVELAPRVVIGCGDWYHTTEYVTTQTLYGSAIGMAKIAHACQQVKAHHFMIPGQHEIVSENPQIITSIAGLSGYGTVCTTESYFDLGGFRIALLPFTSSHARMYNALVTAQQQANLIATHADFAGGEYENYHSSESHLDPTLKVPCVAGDLHIAQSFGSVHYPGSLVQHRFTRTDLSGVGGVLTFDMNTRLINRYPNTRSKHYVKVTDENIDAMIGFDGKIGHNPERVVLQVRSARPKEEIEKYFTGFEYVHIPEFSKQEDRPEVSVDAVDPQALFENFVSQEKPEALNLLRDCLKDE